MKPGPPRRPDPRRRAFTLVEMLVVLTLAVLTLTIIYGLFYQQSIRTLAVLNRASAQQSVRILMMKLRHELKRATSLVRIEKQRQKITIPLEDFTREVSDPNRYYFSEYEYMPESKEIKVRRISREQEILREHSWLGGDSQIESFKAYDTGENERILFQYYRVVIELEHYEVRMRPIRKKGPNDKQTMIHLTTTVYPRRVNMELRIEVPQEGSSF